MWKKVAKKILPKVLKVWANLVNTDEKMIMFSSFNGRGYSDNPKAVFEYMKNDTRYSDFTYVISLHKGVDIEIAGAKIVRTKSMKYFYFILKAKYWVFNSKMPEYLHKKPEQVYLQTWHGTPLKRLGDDIDRLNDVFSEGKISYPEMIHSYEVESDRWDYLLVYSPYTEEIFTSAFMYHNKPVIKAGAPRNERLMLADSTEKQRLREKYQIPLEKKVILYAPTFRDDVDIQGGFEFHLEVNFKLWQEMLGDEYFVLFKPHYLITQINEDLSSISDFVQEVDPGSDINDLYIMSDLLITDYSSVFFDYALLGNPIYFYMYDFDKYKNQLRGFYLDVTTDLPNTVHKTEAGLLDAIQKNQFDKDGLVAFNQKYNPWQGKNSIERIVTTVFDRV